MPHYNLQVLIGNTGHDIETRELRNGNTMAAFSLVTDDGYYDKESKEWRSKPTWHRVVTYNEHIAKRLTEKAPKGSMLLVQGSLSMSTYEDKEGNERRNVETVADKILILRGAEHV